MEVADKNVYLIKKKEDDVNLYNIDVANSSLVYMSSTIMDLDFTNSIQLLSDITKDGVYGKPIDKINIFKIYSKQVKSYVDLFE